MILSLVALCVAAAAMIAFLVSAGAALLLKLSEKRLLSIGSPKTQARVLLVLALLPALTTASIMLATLAPNFGWVSDHCGAAGDPHLHPHLCRDHHVAALPTLTLASLGLLLVARVLWALLQALLGVVASWTLQRRLQQLSQVDAQHGAYVLPMPEPQAFVIGLTHPKLFLTRGLLAERFREHLISVLAHERAHIMRRDPLRRFVASLALAFHLPGIASYIRAQLVCAQEMAADSEAAREIGSRERVAEAIVCLARSARMQPASVSAFVGSNIERRVERLLTECPERETLSPRFLSALAAASLTFVAIAADGIHHAVELLLGVLSI